MTYHSNHSWCSESIWGGECFDGEVIVSIEKFISNVFTRDNNLRIENVDFDRLTYKKKILKEEDLNFRIEYMKKEAEKKGKAFNEEKIIEEESRWCMRDVICLNQEVIDWLEDNIDDMIWAKDDDCTADKKGWAIGTDQYNINDHSRTNIFFARQKDALKFIRHWSVFGDPVSYFDYFHDDSRDMDIKKIINITNTNRKQSGLDDIDIGDVINIPHRYSTDLREETFELIDWEANWLEEQSYSS